MAVVLISPSLMKMFAETSAQNKQLRSMGDVFQKLAQRATKQIKMDNVFLHVEAILTFLIAIVFVKRITT